MCAAGRVASLIRWKQVSIFSVVCIITSGSSCTIPLHFSVFSNCSFEPLQIKINQSQNPISKIAQFFIAFELTNIHTRHKQFQCQQRKVFVLQFHKIQCKFFDLFMEIFGNRFRYYHSLQPLFGNKQYKNLVEKKNKTGKGLWDRLTWMMQEKSVKLVVLFNILMADTIVLPIKLHSGMNFDVVSMT